MIYMNTFCFFYKGLILDRIIFHYICLKIQLKFSKISIYIINILFLHKIRYFRVCANITLNTTRFKFWCVALSFTHLKYL